MEGLVPTQRYVALSAMAAAAAFGVACSGTDAPRGPEGQAGQPQPGARGTLPAVPAPVAHATEKTLSVPIAITTKPYAECRMRPMAPSESREEGLLLYADDEGVVRFGALPELVADRAMRPVIDCKGDDGSSSAYTVDLQASIEVITPRPPSPSSTRTVLPALTGDLLALTEDELMKGGYPPRPDPVRSPAQYSLWRSMVSTPATVVPSRGVPISRKFAPSAGLAFSEIWSGGILIQPSTVYAEVWGEWVVPDVSNSSKSHLNGNLVSSTWVGIGGWSTPAGSQDLIQDGTEQDWQYPGFSTYNAWYEQLPAQAVTFPDLAVGANDTVIALTFASDASGRVSASGGYAGFQMKNVTRNLVSKPVVYQAPGAYQFFGGTVEWIEERPLGTSGQVEPLANFGRVDILGFADDINGNGRTDQTDDNLSVFMYSSSTGNYIADGYFANPGYPGAVGVECNFGASQ
jgi:Peptidase A4 family